LGSFGGQLTGYKEFVLFVWLKGSGIRFKFLRGFFFERWVCDTYFVVVGSSAIVLVGFINFK
jgi:hypothetical protein